MLETVKTQWDKFGKAYAWVLFVDHKWIGWFFLALTFWYPNIGAAGLLAAISAAVVASVLSLPCDKHELHIFNSMLVGLSLGAFFQLSVNLVFIIILSATITTFVTVILLDVFWRYGRLPVLSVPFILIAFTTAFATKSYAHLSPNLTLRFTPDIVFGGLLDPFFTALGAVFFTPAPIVGALLFLALIVRSRYLAFLAATGFALGQFTFQQLAGSHIADTAMWNGFNFSLAAMALGGIFAVPGIASFLLAMFSVSIVAVLTTALQNFLVVYQLPVMATPFLTVTLIVIAGLTRRVKIARPELSLERPARPEVNYARARMRKYRLGDDSSVPLAVPFFGDWQIYQGFNGRHTHHAPWQHALDFYKTENNISYKNNGAQLEDFYCYNLPVLSPAYGRVVRIKSDLPDNKPGEVDTLNNWGNIVLIRVASGLHILLAHLQQNSVLVKEGDEVKPGDVIARCGNSGRSPQPHLHLQAQVDATLGAPTYPFHLVNTLCNSLGEDNIFKLVDVPDEDTTVRNARTDEVLKRSMHLPLGKILTFAFEDTKSGKTRQHTLKVELSILGQFELASDNGARVKFVETDSVLAFFDRQDKTNALLDMWTLALGVTPFDGSACSWQDNPPATLLPLSVAQRIAIALFAPLGGFVNSRYTREWNQQDNTWIQRGEHTCQAGFFKWQATTVAYIDATSGCRQLSLSCNGRTLSARLTTIGGAEDAGVPGWEVNAS